jgi:hypothetical protein
MHFETFTSLAESTLNEAAKLLISSNLDTYISPIRRYGANIVNPYNTNEIFMFAFYGKNGPVQELEIRTKGGLNVVSFMDFCENGKLKLFSMNGGRENISFMDDGRWGGYFVNLYPTVAVELKSGAENTLNVLSYNSSGLLSGPMKHN